MSRINDLPATQPPAPPPGPRRAALENGSSQRTTETVHLSSAAQKALEEAVESPGETNREAMSGDGQAKRLLAKQEAAKEAEEARIHVLA